MKKTGILSMQRIANYGSFLQAYGLKQILTEIGCDVTFVDYHPGKCLVAGESSRSGIRKLAKALDVLKYRAPFREKLRFIKYKKNYAANYYPYLGIDEHMNYAPQLDLLVIGSDEVFNCVQNNTNVGFSPELFGEGNHAERVISYAASFGNTTVQKLEQYQVKKTVGEWLGRLDAVSVRDKNSGEIVKELTQRVPGYHLDPVLVYDFTGKCREIPKSVPEKDYMLLYGYSGRFTKEECAKIRAYANSRKLKIFCIGGVQDCCDRFIDCSPFEVLAYFMHASCVVTDTFHGTIMSIITHRQFVTAVRSSGYGNAEKLTDLLTRLELEDRMEGDMDKLKGLMEKEICYERTDALIKQGRENAYAYLRSQVNF